MLVRQIRNRALNHLGYPSPGPMEWGKSTTAAAETIFTDHDWWNRWPTWQVISPGRSGTRWLADLLIATSVYGIVHATDPTLAKAGFLADQGLLSSDSSWGAYLSSRLELLSRCKENHRALVDLDCKNSPLAPELLSRNKNSRALVLLRNPRDFVRSGIARNYFRHKSPFDWGHLTDADYSHKFDANPGLTMNDQAVLIGRFWGRVATSAQNVAQLYPDRVHIVRVEEMFRSPSYVLDSLVSAGIKVSRTEVLRYRNFARRKNATPTRAKQEPAFQINWDLVESAAFQHLSTEFVTQLGL